MTDKERQERDDAQWVMGTEQGRRFVWRLLTECRVFHDFEGDTNQILKQVGRRQVGLFLTGILTDASEDAFFKMQLEAKNRTIEEIAKHGTRQHTESESFESAYDPDTGPGSYESDIAEFDTYTGIESFI